MENAEYNEWVPTEALFKGNIRRSKATWQGRVGKIRRNGAVNGTQTHFYRKPKRFGGLNVYL